jgi:hypothetical protein
VSISRAIRNQNEFTPSVDRPCLEQKIANRPHAYIEIYSLAVDPSTSKIRYTSKRALKGKPIGQWGPGIRQPAAPARLLERKPCMGPEKQKVRSTIMCPPRNRPSCATQRFGFVENPLFFKKIDLGRVPAQDGRSHPYLFFCISGPTLPSCTYDRFVYAGTGCQVVWVLEASQLGLANRRMVIQRP